MLAGRRLTNHESQDGKEDGVKGIVARTRTDCDLVDHPIDTNTLHVAGQIQWQVVGFDNLSDYTKGNRSP